MLHTDYGCAFRFQLVTSSWHCAFQNLVVCKFYAWGTLLHSYLMGLFALFACLRLRSFLRSFCAFCIRRRLERPCLGVVDHDWAPSLTIFSGAFSLPLKLLAHDGRVCLSTSTDYKQKAIRPRKVPSREGSPKSMRTAPRTRPPNSKNAGLWKAFLRQTPHNVGHPRISFLRWPSKVLDFLGLFAREHAAIPAARASFCWIFPVSLLFLQGAGGNCLRLLFIGHLHILDFQKILCNGWEVFNFPIFSFLGGVFLRFYSFFFDFFLFLRFSLTLLEDRDKFRVQETVLLVNHALARPAIFVIFVVSRGSSSKALVLLVRMQIRHFRHFRQKPPFSGGTKARFTKSTVFGTPTNDCNLLQTWGISPTPCKTSRNGLLKLPGFSCMPQHRIWPGEGSTVQWKCSLPCPGRLKALLFPPLSNKVQNKGMLQGSWTEKRGHYGRGLFTGGISRISNISTFSGISRKWPDSPLFSTVLGSLQSPEKGPFRKDPFSKDPFFPNPKGVQARDDAELPRLISIVRRPGRPVILGMDCWISYVTCWIS